MIQIKEEEINTVLSILSAILILGNVKFEGNDAAYLSTKEIVSDSKYIKFLLN